MYWDKQLDNYQVDFKVKVQNTAYISCNLENQL